MAVNLPCKSGQPPVMAVLDNGTVAAAGVLQVDSDRISVRLSFDDGRNWPVGRYLKVPNGAALTKLEAGEDGEFILYYMTGNKEHTLKHSESWIRDSYKLAEEPTLAAVIPPLWSSVHWNTPKEERGKHPLPIPDETIYEHVRGSISAEESSKIEAQFKSIVVAENKDKITTKPVAHADQLWLGRKDGLYYRKQHGGWRLHDSYGVDGPLSNHITGIAVDRKDVLWVATPAGLSSRDSEGNWTLYRGKQGLPYEELTAITIDDEDRIWLGSTRGLIQYRPYAEGRQWFYRDSERYLNDDHITHVMMAPNGSSVYALTSEGWNRIDEEALTLAEKAEYLLERLHDRKIRLGMPSPAIYDDPYTMESWIHGPQPSDGLWTSYNITAMCMAWSLTGEERYREAAKQGMEALYLLQNITGIKGLVARAVIEVDEPYAENAEKQDNWHLTDDGKYYWRDDVSSDQIDGHYFAFYTYYEHIAKYDVDELARIKQQIAQVTDYIVDNNYQIPDWDGERTKWGWFNPELLNETPIHYLESGIYSLMMLSFLKTTHYITEDDKYFDRYENLVIEHNYLSNLLLQKKVFPEEVNHSDDQLSAICFYPFMQLEYDPYIRDGVHRALRRHARIEVAERNSLFAFTYGSVEPEDAAVMGGVQTLREMPRDRRDWPMDASHRADVVIQTVKDVGGRPILQEVLPADERHFERWNMDPYAVKTGASGKSEGAGVHWLLPYWMGRYHGLIAAPAE